MMDTIIGALIGVIALAIVVIILFAPAIIANGKGHSFWGFFLISLFTWPVALIWAWLILDDKNKESEQ